MFTSKLITMALCSCFVAAPFAAWGQTPRSGESTSVGELPRGEARRDSDDYTHTSDDNGPLGKLFDSSAIDLKDINLKDLGLSALGDLQDLEISAVIRIPQSVITEALNRDFNHSEPVERVILGTHSRGTAHCFGAVTCLINENPAGAELVCTITGNVCADTFGTNGPATIQSRSVTSYVATKQIFFDGRRFTSRPAALNANTRLKIQNVGSTLPRLRGRIVKRVAERRAAESRAEAEAISAAITRRELSERIDAEFDARIVEMNRKFAIRLSLFRFFTAAEEEIAVRSFPESVEIGLIINPKTEQARQSVFAERLPVHDSVELWLRTESIEGSEVPLIANLLRYTPQWLAMSFSENPSFFEDQDKKLNVKRWQDWVVFQLPE